MEDKKNYSQLAAMMAIAKASFRSITRSPSAVVFTLAFPMVFILVFGFISGGGVNIDLGISKNCDTNNRMYITLENIPSIRLHTELEEDEQLRQLQKGSLDGIINISPNQKSSSSKYIIDLQTSAASFQNGRVLKMMIESVIDKMNLQQANLQSTMAELHQTEVHGREYKTIDFILPGQLGFSLLSTGVFGTAFVFFNLRQTLVIKRFFATPIRKPFIVLGEALARLVFALLGASFIICIGYFAFGFTLIHGMITALTMLLLAALGLIVFMGFGFVVSGIAKSESTIPPLANIITLPQFLLSGTFFSIQVFPSWLQPICKVLPLTYLNDAMRKVAFEGMGLWDVKQQLLIILLWGIAVYAAAVKVFKWE